MKEEECYKLLASNDLNVPLVDISALAQSKDLKLNLRSQNEQ